MPRLLGAPPPERPQERQTRSPESSSAEPRSPPPVTIASNPLINSEDAAVPLTCPICNESMLTLTQLNQHLDDEHTTKKKPLAAEPRATKQKQLSSSHITRAHWTRIVPGLTCAVEGCEHAVDRNGVHCRQCGNVFCRPHSVYAKKLDESAQPDPTDGIWARVCRGCFESRAGFNDSSGTVRNLTSVFVKRRQNRIDEQALRVERLEKRMVKLVLGLSKMDRERGLFSYKEVQGKRVFEKGVAPWENEDLVSHCRLCRQRFSYFLRKHHCRTCGLVVCGDMDRDCSRDVAISILAEKLERQDVAASSMYAVRICRDCKDAVFGHRNFLKEQEEPLPEVVQFQTRLKRKQAQIDLLLPRFQELTARLAAGETDPGVVNETSTIRQQLLGSFSQFDNLARKLRKLEVGTQTEINLQRQISLWATNYLQDTMVPLQALPQVLQKGEPRMRKDQIERLQNQIVVLEEQKFMVEEMLKSAKSRRRLDEVGPLEMSLGELDREIQNLRAQLGTRGTF